MPTGRLREMRSARFEAPARSAALATGWLTRAVAAVLLAVLTQACASTPRVAGGAERSLASVIDQAIARPPFDRAFWSILVEDDAGRVLYSHNSEKLTIPASNRKLFSSAAIVSCLGADTRLETGIWLDGEDVVITGDGDPTLGAPRYERQEDFNAVAEILRTRGLRHVRDVIGDVSRFDRTTIPGGWKHGNLGSGYAPPVDAIAWRENQLPDGSSVPDAGLYAANALRDALMARGIEVRGIARVNTDPKRWGDKVASLPSPFVFHLLTTVLKNSHNLYTEMLLKRTAAPGIDEESEFHPAGYDDAIAREQEFLLEEVGLPRQTFRFVDGSGLAPDNHVTPESTVRMLRWMNHPWRRGFWWALLAQPAGEGTLRNRLVDLEQRMRGKTGTVAGVNALSGIVAMPGGEFRYFSIAVNHHIGAGSEANAIIDAIVTEIAR